MQGVLIPAAWARRRIIRKEASRAMGLRVRCMPDLPGALRNRGLSSSPAMPARWRMVLDNEPQWVGKVWPEAEHAETFAEIAMQQAEASIREMPSAPALMTRDRGKVPGPLRQGRNRQSDGGSIRELFEAAQARYFGKLMST